MLCLFSRFSMSHLTHALLRAETACPAAESLRGATGQAEVEGLVELIYQPPSARAAVLAIAALEASSRPIVLDALYAALESPHASVRLVAVQALQSRSVPPAEEPLHRILRQDESWPVRRAALGALAAGRP